ncbi:MAG TPA: hypothetical protein VD929_06785 [Caulobacteraceae bacterium]|nr:hypothetical protein [Caulobacteraceae bacterium]
MILFLSALLLAAAPQVVAPGLVSTDANEYNLTSSADGSAVVFARSKADFGEAKVMVLERLPGGELLPRPVSFSGEWTDSDPQISADGKTLLFVSDRPTPLRPDARDINVWRSRREPNGWSAPEPVTDANSPAYELGPELHGGVLYFNSNRPGGRGGLDLWRVGPGEPPAPLAALNAAGSEGDFTLSPDGRVAVFWSDRPGGSGHGDLYASAQTADGWSPPVNLGPEVNSPAFDFTPSFSADGKTLMFASTRPRDGADRLADVYAVAVDDVPVLKALLGR